MIIAQLWRLARIAANAVARRPLRPASRAHKTHALAALDRRLLSDVGIGQGEILSVPRTVESLRRPPHF